MSEAIRAVGIDPGFRFTGIGAVGLEPDGTLTSYGVRLSETFPSKDKKFRKTLDDERRARLHYEEIVDVITKVKPHVIGVEAYTIFDPADVRPQVRTAATILEPLSKNQQLTLQRLCEPLHWQKFVSAVHEVEDAKSRISSRGWGGAAKTMLVYGMTLAAAYAVNVPVYIFNPSDLKKRVGKRASASKGDVAFMLQQRIPNLKETVESRLKAKGKHEHVYDSTGHGLLALVEYCKHEGASKYGAMAG